MAEKLTKDGKTGAVARMKPGAVERVVFDSEVPGFAVKVLPSGRRVFIYQYRHGGRGGAMRRVTIGEFRDPPLIETDSVDGARRAAANHRAAVLRGEDPFKTLQDAKAAKVEAARREAEEQDSPEPKTVNDLAREYLSRWAKKKRDGGAADKRALDKDVLPEIGTKRIGDVTRRDVVKLLDKIADRGSPVMANRAHALVRRLFNFALARGLLAISPVLKIERATETPRERHLSPEEISIFCRGLEAAACEPGIKALLRFLLVTGRRKSEALFINAAEIDREQNVWTLPGSRMKNGKDFILPLPPMALTILDEIGADEKTGFYFVSERSAKPIDIKSPDAGRARVPYDPRSIDHACRDLFMLRERSKKRGKPATVPPLVGMTPLTPHDLRRTAATMMRSIGVSREDVKLVLGHAEDDVLGRHYDKYEGLVEKRRALAVWTAHLADLLKSKEESNVTTFPTPERQTA